MTTNNMVFKRLRVFIEFQRRFLSPGKVKILCMKRKEIKITNKP